LKAFWRKFDICFNRYIPKALLAEWPLAALVRGHLAIAMLVRKNLRCPV